MLGSYKSNIEKGLRGNMYKGEVGRHRGVFMVRRRELPDTHSIF